MNVTLRTGALALALIAGTVMTAAPAMADRSHHGRYDKSWNKSWNKKHYRYDKHRKYRGHARGHRYYRYGGYGPRRPYGWFGGPGFSIIIR